MVKLKNNYPTIFIHGFCGWGANDKINDIIPYWGFDPKKNLIKHLEEKGYEVYNPSVGPFQSAWDRSCELWAMLNGGTVDYGKVHAKKYGHPRYGRTYKALIPDWGKSRDHAKINIVGHSFGGPTVIAFANLIANGCQEEIDGTEANELSPLFAGGHEEMLHTATTLSGVNNGTTFASLFGDKGMTVWTYGILILNTIIGETQAVKYYDFHTENWGIQRVPEEVTGNKLQLPLKYLDGFRAYNANHIDSIAHEMQVETSSEINKNMKISPKIYYFARLADKSHENENGTYSLDKGSFPLCKAAGHWTGKYLHNKLDSHGVDESWFPNDGFVNLKGQMAPKTMPSTAWVGEDDAKPGIWYNMAVEYKDHMSWAGYGQSKAEYFGYFERMLKMFKNLPVA